MYLYSLTVSFAKETVQFMFCVFVCSTYLTFLYVHSCSGFEF